jgi:hypothetical protein
MCDNSDDIVVCIAQFLDRCGSPYQLKQLVFLLLSFLFVSNRPKALRSLDLWYGWQLLNYVYYPPLLEYCNLSLLPPLKKKVLASLSVVLI